MADLPLDRPAGVLVKTTCVDFPGHLAGSFFLKGCNLRCPYCYNRSLVLGFEEAEDEADIVVGAEAPAEAEAPAAEEAPGEEAAPAVDETPTEQLTADMAPNNGADE